jgi:exonuclease I
LSAREPLPSSEYVEEQIYESFPSQADKCRMERFHAVPWGERLAIVDSFDDARFRLLGRRLIYTHSPESLPSEVRQQEARLLAMRLTGHGHEDPPWLTLATADAEAEAIESQLSGDDSAMVYGFRAHVRQRLQLTSPELDAA